MKQQWDSKPDSAWTREPWQPGGAYHASCVECAWLRVEQFRRQAHRTAREHARETGHEVVLRRQQYKVIKPEATT